jgi:hypothetical protein
MLSVQLPDTVKTVWSGEFKTACATEVNAPGVAPEQSMTAEFSVWAKDRVQVRRSNKKAHNTLGPKERSLMSVSSLVFGFEFWRRPGKELCPDNFQLPRH